LIFQIGREIFNRRAALIAATTVALWPTFLLHTTQLLRDPLFLVGILAFILVILRLLCRSLSWPKALLAGTGGGLLAVFIWLARDNMGALLIAAVLLGTAMLIVRQIREKKFHAASLMGMALLVVVSAGVIGLVPKFRKPHAHRWDLETPGPARSSPGSTDGARNARVNEPQDSSLNPLSQVGARIGQLRRKFIIEYPDAG